MYVYIYPPPGVSPPTPTHLSKKAESLSIMCVDVWGVCVCVWGGCRYVVPMCDITHSYVWHDTFRVWDDSSRVCVGGGRYVVAENAVRLREDDFVSFVHAIWVCRDSFVYVMLFIRLCDLIRSCVSPDTFTCVTWLIQFLIWLIYWFDTGLVHLCGLTPSFVWSDSSICVVWRIDLCDTWLIRLCHPTHLCVWLICVCDSVTRLIHLGDKAYSLRDLTHSFVWYDSWLRGDGCVNYILYIHIIIQLQGVQKLCVCVCVCVCTCVCMGVVVCVMYVWVCIYMSHVTHTYDSFHTYE